MRDLEGWRVPRPGSKSRLIYDWLKCGATTWQIARRFGLDVELTRMLAHKFRHPERANYNEQARRKGKLEKRLPRRNERDSEGWRVPWPGTKSRMIYGLLKYGLSTHEIAAVTGFKPGVVRVLAHKIRPPNWRMGEGPRQALRQLAELGGG